MDSIATIEDAGDLADEYLAFVERLLKFIVGSLLVSLLLVLAWKSVRAAARDEGDAGA
ncbi:MAG: hypothetical protein ABEJ74_05110 [Haloferacaceae archaeon]